MGLGFGEGWEFFFSDVGIFHSIASIATVVVRIWIRGWWYGCGCRV